MDKFLSKFSQRGVVQILKRKKIHYFKAFIKEIYKTIFDMQIIQS